MLVSLKNQKLLFHYCKHISTACTAFSKGVTGNLNVRSHLSTISVVNYFFCLGTHSSLKLPVFSELKMIDLLDESYLLSIYVYVCLCKYSRTGKLGRQSIPSGTGRDSWGQCYVGPGAGLYDPSGCLPTQLILGFFVKEKQVHILNIREKSTSFTKQHSSTKFWL